jgi:hypothetical protein
MASDAALHEAAHAVAAVVLQRDFRSVSIVPRGDYAGRIARLRRAGNDSRRADGSWPSSSMHRLRRRSTDDEGEGSPCLQDERGYELHLGVERLETADHLEADVTPAHD